MDKIQETINEMKTNVEDLEATYNTKAETLDDETKEKAKALVEKTKNAINLSIEKVTAVIDDIKDDEKLNEFLDKVKAKSMEAIEFTKEKIDALTKQESKTSLDDLSNEIMAEFDKLKESEAIKKAAEFLKELETKINDFFEKPEVVSAINKAKTTTVNIAEKGVDGLRKVLKVDEVDKQEECCCKTEEKECCCKSEETQETQE